MGAICILANNDSMLVMKRVTKSESKLSKPTGLAQCPPCIAAIRGRAYHTIKETARMVRDQIFALLGELDVDGFNQAVKFLKAE
eukprot:3203187-Pyramimonas_sp.AAC.1